MSAFRMRSRLPTRPALVAAVAAALPLLSCSPPPDPSGHPNVLLITVDTLRADRLGAYGYHLPTSPNMDRLAAEGVLFRDCTVQWPKTWPSMASLVSGAYPRTTGMRRTHRKLPGSVEVLSEIFGRAGYQTAAVVANFNVSRALGFDQGFDHFVESWQERWEKEKGNVTYKNRTGLVKEYTDAKTVSRQGLDWLRGRREDRPFFLWLHYMDPHGPYVPPAGFPPAFEGAHPAEEVVLDDIPEYQRLESAGRLVNDLSFYRTRYDQEVLYFDDELGRLFTVLDSLGVTDDTLVILTADHGESFHEHGYYLEHGRFPYQATASVPLLVRLPGKDGPRGRIVPDPVGLIDVSSSLVDLAGLPVPESFEGMSLAPVLRGDPDAPVPTHVFLESGYVPDETQLGVRRGRWKLLHVRAEEDRAVMKGAPYELYDLDADPEERINVAGDHPDVVGELATVLEQWYEGGPEAIAPGEEIDLDKLSPEAREMLEALGYTGGN